MTTPPTSEDTATPAYVQFALIDPASLSDWPPEITTQPLVPVLLKNDVEHMPHVVALASLTDEQTQWLQQCVTHATAQGESAIVTAVLSCAPGTTLEAFVAHYNHIQIYEHSEGERAGRSSWLRWHDPRVVAHMPRMLTQAQRQKILGPIQRWSFSYYGKVQVMTTDSPASTASFKSPADMWSAFMRMGYVNRVLAATQHYDYATLQKSAFAIDTWVQRAQQHWGLTDTQDIVTYASKAWLCGHGRFDSHPWVNEVMTAVIKGTGWKKGELDFVITTVHQGLSQLKTENLGVIREALAKQ